MKDAAILIGYGDFAETGGYVVKNCEFETAVEDARFENSCGLCLDLNTVGTGWVEDQTPSSIQPAVTEYVVRFYLYVGDASGEGGTFTLFKAFTSVQAAFWLNLALSENSTELSLYATDDSGIQYSSQNIPVLPGWRSIEMTWSAGNGDGALSLSIDDIDNNLSLAGLDNDLMSIDYVRMGVISGDTETSTGLMDIDSYTSHRSVHESLVDKNCSGDGNRTIDNFTFLQGTTQCGNSGSPTLGDRTMIDPDATVNISTFDSTLMPGTRVASGGVLSVSIIDP